MRKSNSNRWLWAATALNLLGLIALACLFQAETQRQEARDAECRQMLDELATALRAAREALSTEQDSAPSGDELPAEARYLKSRREVIQAALKKAGPSPIKGPHPHLAVAQFLEYESSYKVTREDIRWSLNYYLALQDELSGLQPPPSLGRFHAATVTSLKICLDVLDGLRGFLEKAESISDNDGRLAVFRKQWNVGRTLEKRAEEELIFRFAHYVELEGEAEAK